MLQNIFFNLKITNMCLYLMSYFTVLGQVERCWYWQLMCMLLVPVIMAVQWSVYTGFRCFNSHATTTAPAKYYTPLHHLPRPSLTLAVTLLVLAAIVSSEVIYYRCSQAVSYTERCRPTVQPRGASSGYLNQRRASNKKIGNERHLW